ncbi:hypothetical protein HPB47_027309 [Ixodes persulcatus]|uniref:Uncharacterized protein n=1 Tax=Ixodes persulcatus TaxID=34615 RepID=A0AC60PYP7_IXOPE|nr:hypothetical protein HPB47_027309 [Ixodes persulcatus]
MSASGCMASLLLVSAAVIPATLEGFVCRPEYKNAPPGVVHTACKPPNQNCKISGSGLPNDKKAEFLKLHNDFRMKVAKGELPRFPKAAAMHKMWYPILLRVSTPARVSMWDDEVAEVAQAHADQCTVANRDLRHDNREGRFTSERSSSND